MEATLKKALAIAASAIIVFAAEPAFSADGGRGGVPSGGSYRGVPSGGSYRGTPSGGSHRDGRSGGSYRDGHRGDYHRGGGHHDDWDFNVWLGGPLWSSWWYYPYYSLYYSPYYYPYNPYYYSYRPYYYPYADTAPSLPEEYVQRDEPDEPAESAPSGVWYFCMKSKAYYLYVKECPGGWRTVEASPKLESGGPGPGQQRGVWYYCA